LNDPDPFESDGQYNLEREELEAEQQMSTEAFIRLGNAHISQGLIETALERYHKALALATEAKAADE